MRKVILYPHGGSGNHGCEALVRSTRKILGTTALVLVSKHPGQDERYGISRLATVIDETVRYEPRGLSYLKAKLRYNLLKDRLAYERLSYAPLMAQAADAAVALSFGGDNYCYARPAYIYNMNGLLRREGVPTVLWGCSIEPGYIDDEMLDDLRGYELIIARESITRDELVSRGLKNVALLPDPAFQLGIEKLPLPSNFVEGNTVGVNISPMVMDFATDGGTGVYEAYRALLRHILDETGMNVALIPHVVWPDNDDRVPLAKLYDEFKDSGRVALIADCSAEQLKGYIARCRFVVAARTHASIAAYSTGVPTLVVGYSVKARGLAVDIFGEEEHYVIPVKQITDKRQLVDAFTWLMANERQVRDHLNDMMPAYRDRVYGMRDELVKRGYLE